MKPLWFGDDDNISQNLSMFGESDVILREINGFLLEYTLEGKWKNVIELYYKFPIETHTTILSTLGGTALHAAIELDKEYVVKHLLDAILIQEVNHICKEGDYIRAEALEMKNNAGDTPLHLAASRNFVRICNIIIGRNNERIYLLKLKNNYGETPVFQAVVNGRKQTCAYLLDIAKEIITLQDLVRDDGDSILHAAIWGEYFDLASIIVHYYDILRTYLNIKGFTPLKVLATRPSAFKSASNFSWYKRIIYWCILVEPPDAERTMRSYLKNMKDNQNSNKTKFSDNYTALCGFLSIWLRAIGNIGTKIFKKKKQSDAENSNAENPSNDNHRPFNSEKHQVEFFPPNYETFQLFRKCAYNLGLSLVGLNNLKIAKKKHEWSSQLLKALMERPYESFTGSGGRPTHIEIDPDIYNIKSETEIEIDQTQATNSETTNMLQLDTPLLLAARNGIVEMVNEILNKIPSAIHNKNSNKENVLHVAVKYRQPVVVDTLKKLLNPTVWNNLVLAVDKNENTILHLAADVLGDDKPLQIAGSALQMMWDIKWFQYIKSLVPQNFYFRSNKHGKTSDEIFKKTHTCLIKDSNDWLKEISGSCSVVAILIAGVAFASTSAVPGGITDEGRPTLEGKPALDIFAISSFIGLFFSVSALIMFLSILTSPKQANDFRRDLPLKLYLGLSALFDSIVAMFVSFCTGQFFLLNHKHKLVIFLIYGVYCLPVTFYAFTQFPLYYHILQTVLFKTPVATHQGDKL